MQTSKDRTPRAPRRGRRLAFELIGIFAVVVVGAVALNFAIEKTGTLSDVMWSEYEKCKNEQIDTIVVGSSTAQRSFDPKVIDSNLGSSTFNMATPAQPLEDSCAMASKAIAEHKVKRVVIGVDYETFSIENWGQAHVVIARAKMRNEPFPAAVVDYFGLLTSRMFFTKSDSIGAIFPGGYSFVEMKPASIVQNIKRKLSGQSPIETTKEVEPGWFYLGRGYGNFNKEYDYSRAAHELSVPHNGARPFKKSTLDEMERLCTLCRDNGVELDVVVTPRPAFNVLCYKKDYPQQMKRLEDMVIRTGGHFYDFNLAMRSYYDPAQTDYSDAEHLNYEGAKKFSDAFANVVRDRTAGQDVSSRFYQYDQWEEYCASIDYISAVKAKVEVQGGNAEVRAIPFTGSATQVEYQFLLQKDNADDFEVARDWTQDPTFSFPIAGVRKGMVRVRQVGSSEEYEKYTIFKI